MTATKISSWGRFPIVEAALSLPRTSSAARDTLAAAAGAVTPRGQGRSYGDSALGAQLIGTDQLDCCLEFDIATGRLTCQAGISLAKLLQIIVPRGWFLPVTPGTRFVSVGGAIASDVHGKNHHHDGCFSQFVDTFDLLLASGEIVRCSRQENTALFHATCGGMGLTGLILNATLRLRPVASAFIEQTTLKTPNLDAALDAFEANVGATYSVAWIDCISRGDKLGRSLLMLGEHACDGDLSLAKTAPKSLPVDFPDLALNPLSVRAFNTLYYHRVLAQRSTQRVHYEPYFYPLDALLHWNRMYGRRGFTQYQFVIPYAAGREGLRAILDKIAASGKGSFLAVLKTFGAANDNPLSFPSAGYTLALDFKIDDSVFALLDELDAMVLAYRGRLYLTKDCRMSERTFKQGYPRWEEFQALRESVGAVGRFTSLQSQRLGLDKKTS
jgi:decaprenylphospho-beta-D-ribofuranose 2-oxidase